MNNQIIVHQMDLHYRAIGYRDRSLKALLSPIFKKNKAHIKMQDIHALRNITLRIDEGERVGLIGHNGAGKSTFLKTVAGLYPISKGTLQVTGKICSLFDLSMGFEPDATGRENILYRGLLLGFTPQFMRSKTEEIIEFADLGKFIDYPIKTYSAGMQVRLAFAISTMVEGDILLLDEILGAGDANFMEKARKRITSLVEKAQILVLASHDFSSLQSLCTRGLVFHRGELVFDGAMKTAIDYYRQINGLITI